MHSKYISKFNALPVWLCLLCGWQLQADWSAPIDLSPSEFSSNEPRISLNNSGQARAMWIRGTSGAKVLQNSYFDGTSWSLPQNIYTTFLPNPPYSQISLNDNGKAMVIWRQGNLSASSLHASFFNGSSWGNSVNVTSSSEAFTELKLSFNNADQAVVAWKEDGVNDKIHRSFFNGSTWGAISSSEANF